MSIVIRREDSVMVRDIDGEIVVLDTRSNRVHQFNRTASFIWRMCDEGASPQSIAAALAVHFAIDETTALQDTVKTLTSFKGLDLLAKEA